MRAQQEPEPVAGRRSPVAGRRSPFARALVVGSGATLVDFSVLTTCIRVADLAPATARVPALIAGACVQFFGNRSTRFAHSAGASRGKRAGS